MKIGYCRVSTNDQNPARQEEALKAAGCTKIFSDVMSGEKSDRPQLEAMLEYIRDTDTVTVTSFDRLARSTRDLLRIVDRITERGAEFISLSEAVDTSTPSGRFMLTIFGAMAELEREAIRQRQREGIDLAKQEGRYRGRQPIPIDEERFRVEVERLQSGEQSLRTALRNLSMSKSTFYRRCRERGLIPGKAQNHNI